MATVTSKFHVLPSITSQFHVLGVDAPPPPVPGEVDHSRVDQMSQAQEGAHERLVNYVVNKINDAITGGGAIDESFLQNLQMEVVNQFGIEAKEAQTIVDDAMRQTQNQDQTLDTLEPQPPEQSAQPLNPGVGGVGQGPEPVPVANGAFAKTARGTVGEVTGSWNDIYGDRWVEITDPKGFRESVYADEVERVTERTAASTEDVAAEITAFLQNSEPTAITPSEVRARIANLKLARQEIRRLIANDTVSETTKLALDRIDSDASVELLNLTDTLPGLQQHEAPVEAIFDVAEHTQPSLYGVDELSALDIEPEVASDDIAAVIPEEAATFAADHEGVPEAALLSMAASHIDKYTSGHPEEVRAHHRARFVTAVGEQAQVLAPSRPCPRCGRPMDQRDESQDGVCAGCIQDIWNKNPNTLGDPNMRTRAHSETANDDGPAEALFL